MDKRITIYCHFSFKKPKDKDYGIFAVAFYSDKEGKKLITKNVVKRELWVDQQFISAAQSYENALRVISEYQGAMKNGGIRQVMLVTDNSTLAGWIMDHNKNKKYTEYMDRAVKNYKHGGPKEIVLGVGLCEPRDTEKSYKYCKEEYVTNTDTQIKSCGGVNKLDIVKIDTEDNKGYKSILDIMEEDIAVPEIVGMGE